MKKLIPVIAVAALTLTACGGGDSTANSEVETTAAVEAQPIDSGIYGIVVPDTVEDVQQTDTIYTADLPGRDFEAAAQWMGSHLPDEIDGMTLRDAMREATGHGWCYAAEPNPDGTYRMVYISVGQGGGPNDSPMSVTINASEDDPTGC